MEAKSLSYLAVGLSAVSLLTTLFLLGKTSAMRAQDMTGADTGGMAITQQGEAVISAERFAPSDTEDGVNVFRLTAEPIRWEILPGVVTDAWGYNGQIPGPEIRAKEGERVRIVFTNNLPEATTIHWHGMDVPNNQDGVPDVTQSAIQPGETYTYEFTAKPAGTMWYHSHVNSIKQLDMGLSGAFIVEAKNELKYGQDVTILLDEWMIAEDGANMANVPSHMGHDLSMYNYFTMNGKAFPATQNVDMKPGETVRVRFINAGYQAHPMHLHGRRFKVIATDGVMLSEPIEKDTLSVAPGERYDILVSTDELGEWMLHCHQLHHVANDGEEPGGLMMMFNVER